MPVKVRCPGCRKVLTAPDAARGKALKCPECDTKVRVPAGDEGGAAKGSAAPKAKSVADDDDLLAKLDLSKAQDTASSLCPKCGAEIPDGADECPKCGVDPTTGQLSKAAKRRKSFKGVDPSEFYKVVWGDAWEFTLSNMVSVLQTAFYLILFGSLLGGCVFMVLWCSDSPPKAFWSFLALLSFLAYPGWVWHLQIETIKLTTVKKSSLKDVKFDMFTSFALGIKTIVWTISHAWLPFGTFCLPIALIHFAMPVSGKAWLAPVTMRLSLRHFGAVFYYWLILFVLSIPVMLVSGGVGALYGQAIETAINSRNIRSLGTVPSIVISVAGLVAAVLYGFIYVYIARVNGLIAYYFRDTLELQTIIPEKQYVKKVVQLDKFGNPVVSPMKKYGPLVFALIAIAITGNVICYFATGGKHVLMPDSWARGMKIID